jgi:hypothetical protein
MSKKLKNKKHTIETKNVEKDENRVKEEKERKE